MTPETNRIEYKQQLTDDLEKEATAFLNYHEGGVMYIGIECFKFTENFLRMTFPATNKLIIPNKKVK